MGTFFSELAECEKVVIKDKYIENKAGEMVVFEKETQKILLRLISFVQSGKLTAFSEATYFICKNFRMNSDELKRAWGIKYHSEKSTHTFRSQRSVLGRKYYKLFGRDVYSVFINQDEEKLAHLSGKLAALEQNDVFSEELFFKEICNKSKNSEKFVASGLELRDCMEEIKFLRKILKYKFLWEMKKYDTEKLGYIMYVLDAPIVDAKTLMFNEEKLEVLKAFEVWGTQY